MCVCVYSNVSDVSDKSKSRKIPRGSEASSRTSCCLESSPERPGSSCDASELFVSTGFWGPFRGLLGSWGKTFGAVGGGFLELGEDVTDITSAPPNPGERNQNPKASRNLSKTAQASPSRFWASSRQSLRSLKAKWGDGSKIGHGVLGQR